MADAPTDLGLAERPAATPLYSLAADLTAGSRDLLKERQAAGEKLAGRYELSAGRMEKAASGLEALSETQAKERAAARPPTPTLTPPPSTQPRAFLEPGASVLGQIQTALLGVGQLAMGIAGVSGRGSAIAATAALKGAVEGWQAGDAERVQRSLAEWKTQSDHLLAKHKLARESFDDLLLDHKMTMDQKLAQLKIQGEVLNIQALAEAARVGNLDAILQYRQHEEQTAVKLLELKTRLAQYADRQATIDRAFKATQAQRDQTNAFRRESLNEQKKTRDALLRRSTLKELEPFQKAGRLADGLNELEKIYTTLERQHPELVPKSGELFDAWAARIQRALKPGDTSLFQMKMLWNQVIVGLLERGWSDEKGVRALAVFQSQLNVQDQMPPPDALHGVMRSIRGLVRTGIGRDLKARETFGASPEELAMARMFTETLRDPADSDVLDEMRGLFRE